MSKRKWGEARGIGMRPNRGNRITNNTSNSHNPDSQSRRRSCLLPGTAQGVARLTWVRPQARRCTPNFPHDLALIENGFPVLVVEEIERDRSQASTRNMTPANQTSSSSTRRPHPDQVWMARSIIQQTACRASTSAAAGYWTSEYSDLFYWGHDVDR
jgi:hypothetical protein